MTHPTGDELEAMAVRLEGQCNCNIDTSPCGAEDDCRENQKAAAMLRACKGRVRVKALEWEGDGFWSAGPHEGWMEEANTPFGWGYSIEFGRDGNFMVCSTFNWSQDGFEVPDDAKAAAQADYERRILSDLEPAPDHAEWDAALEAAANVVPQGWCQPSTSHIEMDVDLGQGIQEVIRTLKKGQTND